MVETWKIVVHFIALHTEGLKILTCNWETRIISKNFKISSYGFRNTQWRTKCFNIKMMKKKKTIRAVSHETRSFNISSNTTVRSTKVARTCWRRGFCCLSLLIQQVRSSIESVGYSFSVLSAEPIGTKASNVELQKHKNIAAAAVSTKDFLANWN